MRHHTREAPILAGALKLLALRGFPAWRCNSGALRNADGRLVRFGGAGMSDILGVVPGSGRMLAVECKRPGGKPTAKQAAFLEAVRKAGGVALVCDDLAELDITLDWLRMNPYTVFTVDGHVASA